MQILVEVLRILLAITFVVLSALAFQQWRRRRTVAASWLAATFGILGFVATLDLTVSFLGSHPIVDLVQRLYVPVLSLYPFSLFKFTSSFRRFSSWINRSTEILTASVILGGLLVQTPPVGGPRPLSYQVLLYAFALQWSILSTIVAGRLWISGKGQPAVARRRMRTMAIGSAALTLTIVLAGLPSAQAPYWTVIFRLTALLSGPLFLLGFSPPSWVLAIWRRKDEAALRAAEIGLMKALTPQEVAASLLPKLSQLIGARGAMLLHDRLGVIAVDGLDDDHAKHLEEKAKSQARDSAFTEGEHLWVPLESGWLIVAASPFTPYFGEEETRTLAALGVLTDLAISRADLFERERKNAEAMRDFVAIASHDLRTPITVLKGFARILGDRSERLTEARREEILLAIDRQSTHLATLVEDLLTVSQIEARTVEPQPVSVNLKQVAEAVAQEAGLEGSKIDVRVAPEVTVWVDPEHLHRILMNYVRNAIVHAKPPVFIDSVEEDGFVKVRVGDNGPGVPPDFEDKLFQRFSRYTKKMADSSHGTGLGLSIVRGLAEAAGGQTWYEANRPNGAAFIVKLPKARRSELIAD